MKKIEKLLSQKSINEANGALEELFLYLTEDLEVKSKSEGESDWQVGLTQIV